MLLFGELTRTPLIAQPRMKASSATTVYSSIGGQVRLTVECERSLIPKWTFDAKEIPQLPDDPSLAFQRDIRDNVFLQTLVIAELKYHHYGSYTVETEKDGCKENLSFFVKPESGKLLCFQYLPPATSHLPTQPNPTLPASLSLPPSLPSPSPEKIYYLLIYLIHRVFLERPTEPSTASKGLKELGWY